MKLAIKKKWFDKIKSGEKDWEYRAAHITFVCEETGETLRREVKYAAVEPRYNFKCWNISDMSKDEFEEMFDDKNVIFFQLIKKKEKKKGGA